MINDILDFSKIESGKMELHPGAYELSSLLNDSYNMIALKAKEKNLKFVIEYDETVPEKLYGDEVRIRQILINLLTNAVKYTEKGSITLQVGWEKKSKDLLLLNITVKDTGIGIRQEDQKKLFQSFQRVDERKNRNIEGTGLGLSITKRFLELMGGRIDVKSEYQKGSEFSVVIPQKILSENPIGAIDKPCVPENYKQEQKLFLAPQGRILVVDDVPMNLKVITGLLKNTQLMVDTAESGMQCLALVEKNKYHVIFLDHMMPEMDGIETLELMKRQTSSKNQDTPVIMLTANAVLGAREEYLAAGFRDYLSKPVREDELEKMLLKYLPKELVIEQKEEQNPERPKENLLENLTFLDTASGLVYCGQNIGFYREILETYLNDNKCREIETYFEKNDWENYCILIHALKSTSLSIGAKVLSEEAKNLELAAKENNTPYILAHHKEVMDHYQKLLTQIKSAL